MKPSLINIFLLLLLLTLMNCAEEEVTSREYPRLRTLAVTDITSEGATFNAEFIFRGNFKILNYGFVWDTSPSPRVESSERVVIEGDIHSTEFTREIKSALAENQKYYIRAFVKTEEFIVYGDKIEFISLGAKAPIIQEVRPLSGTLGDTITVSGQNFSYVENKVLFQDYESKIVSASDTMLKIVVPDQIDTPTNTVTVSVKNNLTTAKDKFIVLPPELLELSPNAARTYDTLKIKGVFIGNTPNHVKLNFKKDRISSPDRIEAIDNSNNEISVVVPQKLNENAKVYLTIAGMTDSIEFNYRKPEIISIDKENMSWGDTLAVETQNFYSDKTKFKILLNSLNIPVVDATDKSFSFIIPKTLKEKESQLYAEIAGFDLELDQSLFLKPLEILNLSADSLAIRDMVSIELENLHPENNKVFINNVSTEASLSSDLRTVTFKMPLEAKYYEQAMKDEKVKVSIKANDILVADTIIPFKTPKILSVTQEAVAMGEEVIVKGLNFDPDIHVLKLMGEEAEIKSSTNSEIRFIVPEKPALFQKRDTLNRIPLEISFNESLKVISLLTLKAPIITDITPTQLDNLDQIITISGRGFGTDPAIEFSEDARLAYNRETKFEIDPSKIEIISYSDTEIKFKLTNSILQNDKISQQLTGRIKIKSFGLYSETRSPIYYDHKTYWHYEFFKDLYSIANNSLLNEASSFGFIVGGSKPDGTNINSIYGIHTRMASLYNRQFVTVGYPEWNESNDPEQYIKSSFGFNGDLYIQTSAGKIKRSKFKSGAFSIVRWEDVPIIGNYSSKIQASYSHDYILHILSGKEMIRVKDSDTIHLKDFSSSDYDVLFSKKVEDKFYIAIKNRMGSAITYEVHLYDITNNTWELVNNNFSVPAEKASRNPALGDFLYDENYIYNYDFITGQKSVFTEFPENFSSTNDIDLLFSVSGKLFFYVNDDKMLILD